MGNNKKYITKEEFNKLNDSFQDLNAAIYDLIIVSTKLKLDKKQDFYETLKNINISSQSLAKKMYHIKKDLVIDEKPISKEKEK